MKRRTQISGQKAFRKMRLVPVDDIMYQREKRMRHYDPALTSMATSLHHIDNPVVYGDDYTAALATQNAYLNRLKRHNMQRALATEQSRVSGSMEQPPGANTDIVPGPLPKLRLPSAYEAKFTRLLAALDSAHGAVGRTSADELVVDGVVQRGTSFTNAVRGLYVNTKEPAPGVRQLVRKLVQLRIPVNLLSSKAAHTMYTQGGGGSKHRSSKGKGRILRVF